MTYFDVRFPQLGKATSNVEVSVDDDDDQWEYCIGRAAPPHFQFQTSAQTDEAEAIWIEAMRYMLDVGVHSGINPSSPSQSHLV